MCLPLKLLTRDELLVVAQAYRDDLDKERVEVARLRGIITRVALTAQDEIVECNRRGESQIGDALESLSEECQKEMR